MAITPPISFTATISNLLTRAKAYFSFFRTSSSKEKTPEDEVKLLPKRENPVKIVNYLEPDTKEKEPSGPTSTESVIRAGLAQMEKAKQEALLKEQDEKQQKALLEKEERKKSWSSTTNKQPRGLSEPPVTTASSQSPATSGPTSPAPSRPTSPASSGPASPASSETAEVEQREAASIVSTTRGSFSDARKKEMKIAKRIDEALKNPDKELQTLPTQISAPQVPSPSEPAATAAPSGLNSSRPPASSGVASSGQASYRVISMDQASQGVLDRQIEQATKAVLDRQIEQATKGVLDRQIEQGITDQSEILRIEKLVKDYFDARLSIKDAELLNEIKNEMGGGLKQEASPKPRVSWIDGGTKRTRGGSGEKLESPASPSSPASPTSPASPASQARTASAGSPTITFAGHAIAAAETARSSGIRTTKTPKETAVSVTKTGINGKENSERQNPSQTSSSSSGRTPFSPNTSSNTTRSNSSNGTGSNSASLSDRKSSNGTGSDISSPPRSSKSSSSKSSGNSMVGGTRVRGPLSQVEEMQTSLIQGGNSPFKTANPEADWQRQVKREDIAVTALAAEMKRTKGAPPGYGVTSARIRERTGLNTWALVAGADKGGPYNPNGMGGGRGARS